ncbi:MAG: hypothetical protein R2776_04310 [Flavobacteriaceae bacterium]|nr:hypothetical protein [Flavobacteriaceae bacterium]
MKKTLKPASLLFNFLSLILFFIVGLYVAGVMEAGKNQGLAGGAIVLGWGVLFAGIAFILSFFVTRYVAHKKIVWLNIIFGALIFIIYGVKFFEFQQKKSETYKNQEQLEKKPTAPAIDAEPTAMLYEEDTLLYLTNTIQQGQSTSMGMGFFSPNFYENPVLYFYGNPNLEKGIQEHMPYDSITFKRNKYNSFNIATAPPWLVPEHLKLDYDMLYFKIESITEDFAEVVVNTSNGQTSYINKRSGKIIYWPEFLLSVNSVEFYPNSKEKVRERSFETASIVQTSYQFMKPIKIKGDWAQVVLLDSNFQKIGDGWIQWKKGNKLLITYNLLS